MSGFTRHLGEKFSFVTGFVPKITSNQRRRANMSDSGEISIFSNEKEVRAYINGQSSIEERTNLHLESIRP